MIRADGLIYTRKWVFVHHLIFWLFCKCRLFFYIIIFL